MYPQGSASQANWEYHLRDVLLVKINKTSSSTHPVLSHWLASVQGKTSLSMMAGQLETLLEGLTEKEWNITLPWLWVTSPNTDLLERGTLKSQSHGLLSTAAFNLGQLGPCDIWHCLNTFCVLTSDVEFRRGKVGKAGILKKPDTAVLHRKHPTFCYFNMMV